MAASKIAITLENDTLKRLDRLVKSNFFPNRSKAIQEAVAEKLTRMEKSRLAQECAKPVSYTHLTLPTNREV